MGDISGKVEAMVRIISRYGTNTEATSLAKEIWSFKQSRGGFPSIRTSPSETSLFLLAKNPLGCYGDKTLD